MEVETQTFSTTFDLVPPNTPPFSYSLNHMGVSFSTDTPDSSPSPTNDVSGYTSDSSVYCDSVCDGVQTPSTSNGDDGLHAFSGDSSAIDCPSLEGSTGGMAERRAALKLQKVYRSYRTRRRLADSAVVAEELWWRAIDFARLNHSTVSFFNFSKPETAASRWSRISLNASKVGKGLSKDGKAQKLAFQHWIEAIDPRHRYGHNLHLYYEEWCKADAGQPFFYWLDVGDGKDLELKECPRSKLRQQCIVYLGPQERENYEYIIIEGKIIHKQSGNLLDTNRGSEGAKWIFVMSTAKKLYAGKKKKGEFHHSSFLAGGATLAAGRLAAEDGVLKTISAYSGHYRPTDVRLFSFLSFLHENGVNLNEVQIYKANEDSGSRERGADFEDSPRAEIIAEDENDIVSSELAEISQTGTQTEYKRTLSGGLPSPRAEVPKNAILQRINSKKTAKSYQLGHQLSLKWTTGAGPRIGCVADYPVELRVQALEFVNLSPKLPSMSPDVCCTSEFCYGDHSS